MASHARSSSNRQQQRWARLENVVDARPAPNHLCNSERLRHAKGRRLNPDPPKRSGPLLLLLLLLLLLRHRRRNSGSGGSVVAVVGGCILRVPLLGWEENAGEEGA